MFYWKARVSFKDMSVLDREEVWRDWKIAPAGPWVTQHLKAMALVRNPLPLANWLLELALWFTDQISVSIHEWKVLFIRLLNLVPIVMSSGIWDWDTSASKLCHLRQMLQLAPFSFPASVTSQSLWLPSKAKLHPARHVSPDTLQMNGSIKESSWCQISWRISVLNKVKRLALLGHFRESF